MFKKVATVINCCLFVLCACAWQTSPALTATGARTPNATNPAALGGAADFLPSPSHPTESAAETLEITPVAASRTLSGAADPRVADRRSFSADLAIQISEPVQVASGATAVYTVTVHNHGPDLATGIVLTNGLPGGVTPLWTEPAGPWCGRQERAVRCDVDDLRGGDAVTVTLDLYVGGTETLITSTHLAGVTVSLSAPACEINRDSGQPTVTCRLTRLPSGAREVVRVGVSIDATVKEPLSHTATVAANETDPNPSDNRATTVMIVGAAGGAPITPVSAVADLVVQARAPAIITAGQPFTTTFTIANNGWVDATGVAFEHVVPPATDLVAYAPGLPSCEQQGDAFTCILWDLDGSGSITFTLIITGHSGQPIQIDLDALAPGWPVCTVLKERSFLHILECELGVLKPGQSAQVQTVLVAAGITGRSIDNGAAVVANETDLDPSDNVVTATMTVQVSADLSVRSMISEPAVPGETLSYTLTVDNHGPSDATGVMLTDALPMGVSVVTVIPSQGDACMTEQDDLSAALLVCNLGRLNSGETATVTIVIALDEPWPPAAADAMSHAVEAVSEQADPNLDNNVLIEQFPTGAKPEE